MRSSRREIINIIESKRPADYDLAIKGSPDVSLSYALSSVRNGLLSWLPVKETSKVLLLDWYFGAGLESLRDKAGSVQLVEKDAEVLERLKKRFNGSKVERTETAPEEKFDVIITGSADIDVEVIKQAMAPHTVVYVCFKNAYSYRGELLDRENIPRFSKTAVKETLKRIGLESTLCYYPFPGELFPQAVYSDMAPPDSTVEDRVFLIDPSGEGQMQMKENLGRRIKDGTIADKAEYIIMAAAECRDDLPKVKKAILSIDRERDNCFQVIFTDDKVIKQPVYSEGITKLIRMHNNLCELSSRGIPVINEELTDGKIIMDYFGADNLLSFLSLNPDRTEEMLDIIYSDVLRSSRLLQFEKEKLLQKGYIDMTPFNCWYDGTRLVYFDQEFTQYHCPVSYIMFRAVKYLYIHISGLEQHVKQEYLYDKYDVTRDLERYESMEYRFVGSVRKTDLFSQFWNWRI